MNDKSTLEPCSNNNNNNLCRFLNTNTPTTFYKVELLLEMVNTLTIQIIV